MKTNFHNKDCALSLTLNNEVHSNSGNGLLTEK